MSDLRVFGLRTRWLRGAQKPHVTKVQGHQDALWYFESVKCIFFSDTLKATGNNTLALTGYCVFCLWEAESQLLFEDDRQ